MKFSGYSSDQFNFNPETGLYEKLRKGQPHIDADTGEVLTFANVLVLSTTITSYNGGDLRDVALDSGKGWFFTNGGVAPITWSKGSYKNQFTFTLSDGSPVKGNVGPTFICPYRLLHGEKHEAGSGRINSLFRKTCACSNSGVGFSHI